MTINDLLFILKKKLPIIILIPLVAALLCGGFIVAHDMIKSKFFDSKFKATSELIVSSLAAPVRAIVDHEINKLLQSGLSTSSGDASANNAQYSCKASFDSTKNKILIDVSGPSYEQCEFLANEIAQRAKTSAEDAFKDAQASTISFVCILIPAHESYQAQDSIKKNALKYILLACAGGLAFALILVCVLDMKKRRIKSQQKVEDDSTIHIVGILPECKHSQIISSILLCDPKRSIKSITLLPLQGGFAYAQELKESLVLASETMREKDFTIDVSSPLNDTSFDLTALDEVDCVVLIVRQWEDSEIDLSKTIATLENAYINIRGIIFKRD